MLLLCLPEDRNDNVADLKIEQKIICHSSETLAQCDGTHKSLVAEPKTELNERGSHTHTHMRTHECINSVLGLQSLALAE